MLESRSKTKFQKTGYELLKGEELETAIKNLDGSKRFHKGEKAQLAWEKLIAKMKLDRGRGLNLRGVQNAHERYILSLADPRELPDPRLISLVSMVLAPK